MCRREALWQQVVDFHGHECLGLASGFRVAQAAMEALGGGRDIDEEIVAIVENDSCAVDAIQFLTGCTLGKGNLIFRDYGKQAYTFILRKSGRAVRITVKGAEEEKHKEIMALREKVARGKASEGDLYLLQCKTKELKEAILSRPLDEICQIREIECEIPQKARIFSSVTCSYCGERVMEPRARVRNGRLACIPCAENYSRGWGGS